MDYPPHTILRPPSKFAVDIHRLGHWWASFSNPCWGLHLQIIWEEMVNLLFIASPLLTWFWLSGPCAVENTDCCCGQILKLMAVLIRQLQAKWKHKMKWGGLRRYHDLISSLALFHI